MFTRILTPLNSDGAVRWTPIQGLLGIHGDPFTSCSMQQLSFVDLPVWMQDNYPHMEYTALDLSPYYLYEARKNIKDWHRLRQPKLSMGGVDGSGAHFLQAAAEKIPQPDASHDVVSLE